MSFDNCQNYHPDEVPQLFCEVCGAKIEEPVLVAEGTEYEREVDICPFCFEKEAEIAEVIF